MSLSVLLLLLVCSTQAAHFSGTVMTYYPQDTFADGSVMVNLRYKLNFNPCEEGDTWTCLGSNCGTETHVINNVDEESSEDWCQSEGIMTRLVPSNAPFQLQLNGGNWIDSIKNNIVSWRALTSVEMRNRSDTRKANTSPQTTIIPTVRVPSNCQRNLSLLMFDPDGDEVKCRNGDASLSECNPCTPPPVLSLSSSSCTLSFSPTSSINEGLYVVQLVMEDFPRQTITLTQTNGTQTTITTNTAISKIPIQFVLGVDPAAPSCTEGFFLPRFLPPTPAHRSQLYSSVSQTLEINVNAEALNSSISELLYSGPYSIAETKTGPGQFTLRWTPSESENGQSHPICFVVQALSGGTKYHSELRCVIVTVTNAPTITLPTTPATTTPTSTPATTLETTPASTLTATPETTSTITPRTTPEITAATSTPPTTAETTTPNSTRPSTFETTPTSTPPTTLETNTPASTPPTTAETTPPTSTPPTTLETAPTSTPRTIPEMTAATSTPPTTLETNTPASTPPTTAETTTPNSTRPSTHETTPSSTPPGTAPTSTQTTTLPVSSTSSASGIAFFLVTSTLILIIPYI